MDNPCTQCHSGFCSAHQHPEHAVWEQITQEHAALGNQVTAFAAAIRNAALEEAAQEADKWSSDLHRKYGGGPAAAIRAMKSE